MTLRRWLRSTFELGEHPLRFQDAQVSETGDVIRETLRFTTGSGEPVRGILMKPARQGRHPAVLYIHAHGGQYGIGASELVDGRPALQSPLGPVLARMGFVVLAIDLPCFGERATVTENAVAKARLWMGKSLAGQMLGELASALDCLAGRDDVDAGRIGAYGISMGATFSYWLAAADERLAWIAHQCCYCDLATLVAMNMHDRHGQYLTVPGLLAHTTTGAIAGLVAPRPQLIMLGDKDALTPPEAIDRALVDTRAAYAAVPDRLEVYRETDTGHQETPAMRERLLQFLRQR